MKHRLIGACVLIALAVIFLPLFFDNNDNLLQYAREKVPKIPHQQPMIIPTKKTQSDNLVRNRPIGASQLPVKIWAIQLASFADSKNALSLQNHLRKQGYAAYVQQITQQHKIIYRVIVGPIIQKDHAQDILTKLVRQEKLSGMLIVFNPLEAV